LQSDIPVKDGRARGTVQMQETHEFFVKVFIGSISFDDPLLTRGSTPAKRLTDAPSSPTAAS